LCGSLDTCITKALEQTADYTDKMGAGEAHLVIFNRDDKVDWSDKTWHRSMVNIRSTHHQFKIKSAVHTSQTLISRRN
jgi:hypothetical protein